jgi:hypothetical protein
MQKGKVSSLFKFMFLAGTMRCNQKIGVYPERKEIYEKMRERERDQFA